MMLKHSFGFGLVVLGACALTACGGEGSASAPASGASGTATAKPTAAVTATATATAAATPTATATATATAAAAAAVAGIKPDEMVAASCDSIDKDSECGEVVVKAEGEKAKMLDLMKKICKGKVTDTACAASTLVGTCRVGKDMINHYSSEGPKKYTAETAKKACEKGHGHWVEK